MTRKKIYKEIISLMVRASQLAHSVGIKNILQPGLVKEMIIADILGHVLIFSKRDADAHAVHSVDEKYEYLTCKEGGAGQIDRMVAQPHEKRQASLSRITRNHKIYLAIFYEDNQIRCKRIYEIDALVMAQEAERQLDQSSNVISHISFSESWAQKNGKVVFDDDV